MAGAKAYRFETDKTPEDNQWTEMYIWGNHSEWRTKTKIENM